MSNHAWFCAGLECLCAAASVALWVWTGQSPFLFLAGVAGGAALVFSAVAVVERRSMAAAERRERIG